MTSREAATGPIIPRNQSWRRSAEQRPSFCDFYIKNGGCLSTCISSAAGYDVTGSCGQTLIQPHTKFEVNKTFDGQVMANLVFQDGEADFIAIFRFQDGGRSPTWIWPAGGSDLAGSCGQHFCISQSNMEKIR